MADLTDVATWSGFVYVAFVMDTYPRHIVGWRASTNLRTGLAFDALERGLWTRARDQQDVTGLVHRSDSTGPRTSPSVRRTGITSVGEGVRPCRQPAAGAADRMGISERSAAMSQSMLSGVTCPRPTGCRTGSHRGHPRAVTGPVRCSSRDPHGPRDKRSYAERVTRIELALSAWEADVLPLNYTRDGPGAGRQSSKAALDPVRARWVLPGGGCGW